MIRRYLDGDEEPLGPRTDADGKPRSREQIMAAVHESNEDWVSRHRALSLNEIVAVGQQVRSETLALLSEVSDEQLSEKSCPARPGRTGRSAAYWLSTATTGVCTGPGSAKVLAHLRRSSPTSEPPSARSTKAPSTHH